MAADLKNLETHLKHTIKVALAAQEKLSAARKAAGVRDPQSIYTAAEVKELRVEFHEEWVAFFKAEHSGEFKRASQRLFEVASSNAKKEFFASLRAVGEKHARDNAVNIKKGR